MNNKKHHLTREQVAMFVEKAKYKFNPDEWFLSRCIDGRYECYSHLEPLAKPGADIGDLMMMLSANNQYLLGISRKDILKVLLETIGGERNFRIHTDGHNHHHDCEKQRCLGCGHLKQAAQDNLAYCLEKEDVDFMFEALTQLKRQGIKDEVLEGDHCEKAVIIIDSKDYSLLSEVADSGELHESFIYQKTLDDKRRMLIAKNLLPYIKDTVQMDIEDLYEGLTTVSDQQLFETVARLAAELPIYKVKIDSEGKVIIEE